GRVVADRERPTHAALVRELPPPTEVRRAARRPPDVAAQPVLVVRSVSGERPRGCDVVVRRGEIVGLAGLAGSGARELLLTIAGSIPWERGDIELNGRPLR